MRLTIYRKMMIGFGLVIGLMIAVNLYVLTQLHNVSTITHNTLSSDVQTIDLAKAVQSYLTDEERYAQKFVITRDSTYIELLHDRTRQVGTVLDSLMRVPADSLQTGMLGAIVASHRLLAASFDRARKQSVARREATAWADSVQFMYDRLDRLIRRNQLLVGESMARVEANIARSANVVLVLILIAVLVAVIAAFIITRTITQPIRILERGTAQIARGIFEPVVVHSHDEIAQLAAAVNDMAVKLKQVNEAKAEMMHTISHELRTPLQTALSAHYLLVEEKAGPLNNEQRRLLAMIRQNIDTLSTFSHQFLDLEKMEAGMMQYAFERCDLHALLARVVEEAGIGASRKRLRVTIGGISRAHVTADPAKLTTALTNLIGNAVKYTPAGGAIDILTTEDATKVRVAITDTGIGIAREDIPKLFTKFYRASNASEESARGTGIGLALVKAIVEAHKGTLSVESTIGKGSTFTVELPASASEKNL